MSITIRIKRLMPSSAVSFVINQDLHPVHRLEEVVGERGGSEVLTRLHSLMTGFLYPL